MCFYNTFAFDCGCESQCPTFISPCTPARPRPRYFYPHSDRSRGPPQCCHHFVVNQAKTIPGKCTSHRLEAQIEKRIRALKEEIARLKEDVAGYQDDIDLEKKARRARNRGCRGQRWT